MQKLGLYLDEDEDNPVLLWLFRHGWEEPGWGRSPAGQVATALIIHELAGRITDDEMSRELKAVAGKIMESNAGKVASAARQ